MAGICHRQSDRYFFSVLLRRCLPETLSGCLFRPKGFDNLWYPVERNAFKRLPVIGADINDIYVYPDGKRLWAVGHDGVILHSRDGGSCWQPQIFPSGPVISDEARNHCRTSWWPGLPTLVPNAEAAEVKDQITEKAKTVDALRTPVTNIEEEPKRSAVSNEIMKAEAAKSLKRLSTKPAATRKSAVVDKKAKKLVTEQESSMQKRSLVSRK